MPLSISPEAVRDYAAGDSQALSLVKGDDLLRELAQGCGLPTIRDCTSHVAQ